MEEPQILPTSAIKQNYSKLLWLTELSFMVKAQGIPIPAPIWSKILVMPYSPWVTYLFSVWPHIKLILNYINSSNSIWVKHRLEQNKVVFFPLTQLIFSLEKCFYEHVYAQWWALWIFIFSTWISIILFFHKRSSPWEK